MQTQVLSGRVLSQDLAVTNCNYQDPYTHCNHSETTKTNGEKLHKFIILTSTESNSNQQRQENTNKSTGGK